ncbi:hypothetical protein ABVV53_01850 [Novosphingobium sp. RD2P27]|uniref:Uncharacterized protein n=1 Tax=Novosphingobium kalidii TaxID=3230299 RepID=A0ABV2CX92_9SPHN
MAQYLAVDEFKRVGAYLEELDYNSHCEFLTPWAASDTRFEMTEYHSNEVGKRLVPGDRGRALSRQQTTTFGQWAVDA